MFSQLCEDIRQLTLQAAELVSKNEIEQCQSVLVKRQVLLDELIHQYQASLNNEAFKLILVELIRWVQQQDAVNSAKVIKLKEDNKDSSVAQLKISKALHHYKNII